MNEFLFRDEYYQAEMLGRTSHATTVVAFRSRRANGHPTRIDAFGAAFLPGHDTLGSFSANFVAFSTARNCWYLDPRTAPAIEAIKARFGDTRIVTYGSSMGGFAALNLAGDLGADYALALSPLSTLDTTVFDSLRDSRFPTDREILSGAGGDRIAGGALIGQRGLIAYDGQQWQDAGHARRLASLTSCTLLDVPHSGHPCGKLLHKLYPLQRLLADVIAGEPPLETIRKTIAVGLPAMQEYQSANFETLPRFLDRCREDPAAIHPVAWLNAAQTLRDHGNDFGADAVPMILATVDLIIDPRSLKGMEGPQRGMALMALFRALIRQRRRDLALSLADRHLPPEQAAKLRETTKPAQPA